MMESPAGGTAPRTIDCPEARISLGVYVLGAIDPAERALVDAHLATCRDCRDELAGLAGLPALLARVSMEEAIALAATDEPFPAALGGASEPPRELLATVLDLTAARRRRRRWREASLGLAANLHDYLLAFVQSPAARHRLALGQKGRPVHPDIDERGAERRQQPQHAAEMNTAGLGPVAAFDIKLDGHAGLEQRRAPLAGARRDQQLAIQLGR